ncbi:hypothetical protein ENBRE01_2638, partial [Enteropsectra breve]
RTKMYITNNGNINMDALREFFRECATFENSYLSEKKNNLIRTRKLFNLPFDAELEFDTDNEWGKERYYREKMNVHNDHDLSRACVEYIRGMQWVYRYYFYDVASWEWFYPFYFAPFMEDLAYVPEMEMSFSLGKPLKPMCQLLCVLHPLSSDLVPECMQSVFQEHTEMYPTEFEIDSFQKCMDWQAIPILPFMDVSKIVEGFNQRQNMLSNIEAERNVLGYNLLYSTSSKFIEKIKVLNSGSKYSDSLNIDSFKGRVYVKKDGYPLDETVNMHGFKYVNRAAVVSFDQRKI